MSEALVSTARPRAVRAAWVRLVREAPVAPGRVRITGPGVAHALLAPKIAAELVEVFYVVALDSQCQVLGCAEISRGIVNSSLVHPREIFRVAIALGASGLIVAHNHPSGDPTPSAADRAVTRQLVDAGRLLDLPVYDHVVCTPDRFVSFAEAGLL